MNDNNNGISWTQVPTQEANGRRGTATTGASKSASCLASVFGCRPMSLALGLVVILATLLLLLCFYAGECAIASDLIG